MRELTYHDQKLRVHEHIITRNFWEYYVLDNNKKRDIRTALVMGFETEIGDYSESEIKPYVMSREAVNPNTELMPPPGGQWS